LIPAHGKRRGQHKRLVRLIEDSPLRQVDPRVKLELGILAALAVMLPLERLAIFWVAFALILFPLKLVGEMWHQIRRIAWILIVLFVLDWLFVGPELAVLITLRFTLVVSAFVIFFATTRPEEFRLALECLGLPYRYAFSLSLAFLSIPMMSEEWQAIREAQRSRGAWELKRGLQQAGEWLNDLMALGVPAIVLTVKRAWTFTEAAYARGFDSPHRKPYQPLIMRPADWALSIGALIVIVMVFTLR
jgi:energy-coupling factor transporter transmembrane protein EcfT